ncbi:bifunctional hydroxymethylpyrimidine kinase/phosphomethylpyrimidine kinase [Gracilibacillus sp. YIM 98692]|uniref:bifunctional hydroxymethylpyrimidine kinase/phosphomethylpyrimidine kinase n=1 Tax=Gracilibacillus sp. YIM 98692 TaxID=2663532 RepID=UPI0013D88948|nr:bifunctional hydroxymethylpyrimidine kinase/phosphomethylpyrimidine kinase [Gracilibacillus sp. YIM 98692]
MERVLTIAGSAAQGSAGIQADLKTFQEQEVYGMSVITATVANQSRVDKGIFIRPIEEIEAQFYASIEMVGVDAVKTGMLFSAEIIEKVSHLIAENPVSYIIVDPVMIGKMGSQLLADDAIETLQAKLIPKATIITPNRLEAAKLLDKKVPETIEELKDDAKALYQYGPEYVFIKGGSIDNQATDVLFDGNSLHLFQTDLVNTIHTSGAGCSFAACLTAEFAKGHNVYRAIETSKQFVYQAIKHAIFFGNGIGSVQHAANRLYREENG